jgi:hypothetical protein
MKRLLSGSIFGLTVVLLTSGCANLEPDDGTFSDCIFYEADGMMYMECPLRAFDRETPDRTPHKHSPVGRVEQRLRTCPVSQCHETFCWNLCEVEGDLCIYSARPKDRPTVPDPWRKTNPDIHQTD